MAAERVGGFLVGAEVPDFEGVVGGGGGEERAVEVEADDAGGVAGVGFEEVARAPVPDADGFVEGAGDQFRFVELETADARGVAAEGAQFGAGFDVPDFDGRVVGAGGEDVVGELQAHDAVGVAFEDLGAAAAVFPVGADEEAVFVDVFPGTDAGLEVGVALGGF